MNSTPPADSRFHVRADMLECTPHTLLCTWRGQHPYKSWLTFVKYEGVALLVVRLFDMKQPGPSGTESIACVLKALAKDRPANSSDKARMSVWIGPVTILATPENLLPVYRDMAGWQSLTTLIGNIEYAAIEALSKNTQHSHNQPNTTGPARAEAATTESTVPIMKDETQPIGTEPKPDATKPPTVSYTCVRASSTLNLSGLRPDVTKIVVEIMAGNALASEPYEAIERDGLTIVEGAVKLDSILSKLVALPGHFLADGHYFVKVTPEITAGQRLAPEYLNISGVELTQLTPKAQNQPAFVPAPAPVPTPTPTPTVVIPPPAPTPAPTIMPPPPVKTAEEVVLDTQEEKVNEITGKLQNTPPGYAHDRSTLSNWRNVVVHQIPKALQGVNSGRADTIREQAKALAEQIELLQAKAEPRWILIRSDVDTIAKLLEELDRELGEKSTEFEAEFAEMRSKAASRDLANSRSVHEFGDKVETLVKTVQSRIATAKAANAQKIQTEKERVAKVEADNAELIKKLAAAEVAAQQEKDAKAVAEAAAQQALKYADLAKEAVRQAQEKLVELQQKPQVPLAPTPTPPAPVVPPVVVPPVVPPTVPPAGGTPAAPAGQQPSSSSWKKWVLIAGLLAIIGVAAYAIYQGVKNRSKDVSMAPLGCNDGDPKDQPTTAALKAELDEIRYQIGKRGGFPAPQAPGAHTDVTNIAFTGNMFTNVGNSNSGNLNIGGIQNVTINNHYAPTNVPAKSEKTEPRKKGQSGCSKSAKNDACGHPTGWQHPAKVIHVPGDVPIGEVGNINLDPGLVVEIRIADMDRWVLEWENPDKAFEVQRGNAEHGFRDCSEPGVSVPYPQGIKGEISTCVKVTGNSTQTLKFRIIEK
ncbi:MAG: hypothetical protein AAB365_03595 [Patescibacteria group bacterium]